MKSAQKLTFLTNFEHRCVEIERIHPGSPRTMKVYRRAIQSINRTNLSQLDDYVQNDMMSRYLMQPESMPLDRGPWKYFDIALHLRVKAENAVELDLDQSAPLRILDLGAGGGHFAFIAACLGHSVLGLDMDIPEYRQLLACFGVERVVHQIVAGAPLPVQESFDLVTAFEVTFNNQESAHTPPSSAKVLWTGLQWRGFLTDLARITRQPGRIFLRLNRQVVPESGQAHGLELLSLFESWGASVDRARVNALFSTGEPGFLGGDRQHYGGG